MQRWLVELEGDRREFAGMARLFRSPEACVVERGGTYYLASTQFETMRDAGAVLDVARGKLARVAGIMVLRGDGCGDIRAGAVVLEQDGTQRRYVFGAAKLCGRGSLAARADVVRADATRDSGQEPTHGDIVLSLASRDGAVRQVLRLLRYPTWANLYKVYDIVKHDVRGEHVIWEGGWATKEEVRLFRQTAQDPRSIGDEARHGVVTGEPPKEVMALRRAQSLFRRIVQKWLDSKGQPTP